MTDRHGPMGTGRFKVEIDNVEVSGWITVSIPSRTTEYGDSDVTSPWGETFFEDLVMERGVQPGDMRLFNWAEAVRDGDDDTGIKDVRVISQNEEGEQQIEWEFQDAWIKMYDPPDLDAADGEVAREKVTLAFENIDRTEL